MSAFAALAAARAAGVRLTLEDGKLIAEAPKLAAEEVALLKSAGPDLRRLVFEDHVTDWLNRHHPGTSPGRCAHCARAGGVLLPIGVGPHAWVHDTCHDPWRAARRAQAIAVLASYGITKPDAGRTSYECSLDLPGHH